MRHLVGAVCAIAATAVAATSADAVTIDPQESSNWAGYAIAGTDETTGAALSFRAVSGAWTQPRTRCSPGRPSYSAFWIGLGGALPTSQALEQVGTSSDCTAAGKQVSYVWYEVVPAPSVHTKLKIAPGDRMQAVVVVDGTQVTMRIQNVTRHTVFTKRMTVAKPDVSSAEWIAEAPSGCDRRGRCNVLPLANFGTVSFTKGQAITTDSRSGTIGASQWATTPIKLTPDEVRTGNIAVPGPLSADGSSFSVSVATS